MSSSLLYRIEHSIFGVAVVGTAPLRFSPLPGINDKNLGNNIYIQELTTS
jgi:hypothetical protein